jgi:uncharacterized OB-fold protein
MNDELSDAARRILQKRLAEQKQLMLSCQRCGEYFVEAVHYEDYCNRCRSAGRPT